MSGNTHRYKFSLSLSLLPSDEVSADQQVQPPPSLKWSFVLGCHSCPHPFLHGYRTSFMSGEAPPQASGAGQPCCHSGQSLGLRPLEGHRAIFWQASMSEWLWRFPRTIQIAFFTPHCTMPTLIHIICALAKCTLSDPSPCKTLQEESVAPVGC